MSLAAVARPVDEPVDHVRRTDDGAEVTGLERDVVRGEVHFTVVFDA